MKKYKVAYCGNVANVADQIFLSEYFILKKIFIEREKCNAELLTFCKLRNIPFQFVDNKEDLFNKVKNTPVIDLLLIYGFGIILPKSLIDLVDSYNFHPGKLPNYKGRHPTFFATIEGNSLINLTLHKVSLKIDEGEIIYTLPLKYRFNENEIDLQKKIYNSIEVLLPYLYNYLRGKTKSKIIPGGKYFSPVSLDDKTFTENDDSSKILNILRAQAPYDGGIFKLKNNTYLVRSAEVNLIDANLNIKNKIVYQKGGVIGIVIDEICWLKFTEFKKK